MAVRAPAFFVWTYVPGYLAGLLLCAVHGHYEHAAGTTSHYGRLYNLLCFNDGYQGRLSDGAHVDGRYTRGYSGPVAYKYMDRPT